MEGTGANLRLPLNPLFFESEVRYDTTSGGGTIATGFEGLQPLDRPSGQLRAWGSRALSAIHPTMERLRGIPAGIAFIDQRGLRRQLVERARHAD